MIAKVFAIASLAFTAQSVQVYEQDFIAIALAESLSTSAQHLVQMASALEAHNDEPEQVAQVEAEKTKSVPLPF